STDADTIIRSASRRIPHGFRKFLQPTKLTVRSHHAPARKGVRRHAIERDVDGAVCQDSPVQTFLGATITKLRTPWLLVLVAALGGACMADALTDSFYATTPHEPLRLPHAPVAIKTVAPAPAGRVTPPPDEDEYRRPHANARLNGRVWRTVKAAAH